MTGQAMASPIGAGLGSLFDLQGVYGSFLVTTAGDVVARALPEVVDDATLFEVGGRVVYAASVRHPGTRPNDFLSRAMREVL